MGWELDMRTFAVDATAETRYNDEAIFAYLRQKGPACSCGMGCCVRNGWVARRSPIFSSGDHFSPICQSLLNEVHLNSYCYFQLNLLLNSPNTSTFKVRVLGSRYFYAWRMSFISFLNIPRTREFWGAECSEMKKRRGNVFNLLMSRLGTDLGPIRSEFAFDPTESDPKMPQSDPKETPTWPKVTPKCPKVHMERLGRSCLIRATDGMSIDR